MTLRPYQNAVVEAAKAALSKHGSAVLQMPTGGGKTKAATALVSEHDGGVWFVCHRREIIRQASAAFCAAGIAHGIIAPGHKQRLAQPFRRLMGARVTPAGSNWDQFLRPAR
jgi:DNA repair protein RadD